MSRTFVSFISLAFVALIAAMILSCGSSSKSPTACTGGPFNIVGPWQITVTDNGGGSVGGFGAIDSAGLALFFDNTAPNSTGDTIQLPTLTGACSFTGNINEYSEPGGPNSGNGATDPVSGNVNSASSISGSFTGTPSGTISLSPLSAVTSVTALTGSMFGQVEGSFSSQGILAALVFTPSGTGQGMTFGSPNNTGCIINGSFTQVGTGNVFDVSMTFSQSCPFNGTFSGIGFESNADYFNFNTGAAGTYLYADMLNSGNTFVMEIYP